MLFVSTVRTSSRREMRTDMPCCATKWRLGYSIRSTLKMESLISHTVCRQGKPDPRTRHRQLHHQADSPHRPEVHLQLGGIQADRLRPQSPISDPGHHRRGCLWRCIRISGKGRGRLQIYRDNGEHHPRHDLVCRVPVVIDPHPVPVDEVSDAQKHGCIWPRPDHGGCKRGGC